MRLFELIFLLATGSVFLWIGWRIWKKEEITLIHSHHYTKISKKDIKPYTEKLGKALLIMGMGLCLTGIIDFVTHTLYGWIAFIISFVSGLLIILLAQIKYNHSIF